VIIAPPRITRNPPARLTVVVKSRSPLARIRMLRVVIQRAYNHASRSLQHPLRLSPPRVGKISHRTAVSPTKPFINRGMLGKSLQRRHSAKRKPERSGPLYNPRCIARQIHDLIVPQEGQACQAAGNGKEESRSLRKIPVTCHISLTYVVRLLIRYRPLFPLL